MSAKIFFSSLNNYCNSEKFVCTRNLKFQYDNLPVIVMFQAKDGVPALLVYKAGEMIGNFIRISDELGDDFFSSDVESILEE